MMDLILRIIVNSQPVVKTVLIEDRLQTLVLLIYQVEEYFKSIYVEMGFVTMAGLLKTLLRLLN